MHSKGIDRKGPLQLLAFALGALFLALISPKTAHADITGAAWIEDGRYVTPYFEFEIPSYWTGSLSVYTFGTAPTNGNIKIYGIVDDQSGRILMQVRVTPHAHPGRLSSSSIQYIGRSRVIGGFDVDAFWTPPLTSNNINASNCDTAARMFRLTSGGAINKSGAEVLRMYNGGRNNTSYMAMIDQCRDWLAANVASTIEAPASSGKGIDMYRMYNASTGEHLYTAQRSERDTMIADGWLYEGVMWHAPEKSNIPVWRLYNQWTGGHHYARTKGEYEELQRQGWTGEGIVFYSDDAKGVPVYRLYNPYETGAGSHNYTTSTSERDTNISAGWEYEDVGWYGLK